MIRNFAIVAIDETFLIFGGLTKDRGVVVPTNVIASFNTRSRKWQRIGEMKEARYGHGVILHQGKYIVVGGRGHRLILAKSQNGQHFFPVKVNIQLSLLCFFFDFSQLTPQHI